MIDTYGTFALLYTWFPEEAVEYVATGGLARNFLRCGTLFLHEMLRKR